MPRCVACGEEKDLQFVKGRYYCEMHVGLPTVRERVGRQKKEERGARPGDVLGLISLGQLMEGASLPLPPGVEVVKRRAAPQ